MKKILLLSFLALIMSSHPLLAKEDDHDHDGGHYPDYKNYFRLDCRYHNIENNKGANFCYASAVYQFEDGFFKNVHLGVGCDKHTLFYDRARVHVETTLDRLSPVRAATPGVEVFPQGQLTSEGTYTSELDISLGRFQGLCYVHKMEHKHPSLSK